VTAPETVSLKEHFEALRAADQKAVDLVSEWTKERLETHNNLLNKWRDATDRDRETFVSRDSFNALKASFDVYKEITAKALALAEGKSKGFDVVRTAVSFAAGLIIAGVAVWGWAQGFR